MAAVGLEVLNHGSEAGDVQCSDCINRDNAGRSLVEAVIVAVIDGGISSVNTPRCRGSRVRLIQVDAPERGQPYGARSWEVLMR